MDRRGIDTRLLTDLTEQSQDLHSDAMRITGASLADFTEEVNADAGRAALVAATGLSMAAVTAGRAFAAANADDIMALQTAASIENLAVSVYTTAAGLPFIKTGNPVVAAFITETTAQHKEHAQAFNAAISAAGGKTQTGVNPKYQAAVTSALPGIKTPADVVALALQLEDVAAQTYTKYVGLASSPTLRTLFGSVAPVEAQHRSVLLSVQALLKANEAGLIALPTDPAKLPAAAGSVGIPVAFYPTTEASPVSEGAVK